MISIIMALRNCPVSHRNHTPEHQGLQFASSAHTVALKGGNRDSLLYGLVMAPLFFTRVGLFYLSGQYLWRLMKKSWAGSAVVE